MKKKAITEVIAFLFIDTWIKLSNYDGFSIIDLLIYYFYK